MAQRFFSNLKNWFSSKNQLVQKIEKLEAQMKELKSNVEMMEKNTQDWKRKSDKMDLLGDENMLDQLLNYGAIDSIINVLEDYKKIKSAYEMQKNNKENLKCVLGQKSENESTNNRQI